MAKQAYWIRRLFLHPIALPALGEAIVFLSYFDDLPDARQAGKVRYLLDEVLLLCLLAVLAGPRFFKRFSAILTRDAWKVAHTAISLASKRSGGTG